MLYSTSPSSSSAASTSGRSSPEAPLHDGGSSSSSRSASSFLPPFFTSAKQTQTQHQLYQQQPKPTSALDTPAPPRRTSFGTALGPGGKLSALSALGFFPSTSPTESSSSTLVKPDFGPRSSGSAAADSAVQRSSSGGEAQATRPQQQQRRHMCFPDGMGGTMCVEIRDRDRRGST